MPQDFDGFPPSEIDPFDSKGGENTFSFDGEGVDVTRLHDGGDSEGTPDEKPEDRADKDGHPNPPPQGKKKISDKVLAIGGVTLAFVGWFGYQALTGSSSKPEASAPVTQEHPAMEKGSLPTDRSMAKSISPVGSATHIPAGVPSGMQETPLPKQSVVTPVPAGAVATPMSVANAPSTVPMNAEGESSATNALPAPTTATSNPATAIHRSKMAVPTSTPSSQDQPNAQDAKEIQEVAALQSKLRESRATIARLTAELQNSQSAEAQPKVIYRTIVRYVPRPEPAPSASRTKVATSSPEGVRVLGATHGEAWVSVHGEDRQVRVGDVLPGIGVIQSIRSNGTILGSSGSIHR